MSPAAQALRTLDDASRTVRYCDRRVEFRDIHRLYYALLEVVATGNRPALLTAITNLRAASKYWAEGPWQAARLGPESEVEMAPHLARVVHALDDAVMFALVAEGRATELAAYSGWPEDD